MKRTIVKDLLLGVTFVMAVVVSACSSNSKGSGANDGTADGLAVERVRKQLKGMGKMTDHKVVKGPMPVEMMADRFKGYRDAVFKAQLDYNSCQVRGIQMGMDKAMGKLLACQEGIIGDVEELNKALADEEYTFVLATVKEKSGRTSQVIAVFNPETTELEQWVPVTTPLLNNAVLITNALNHSLPTHGPNQPQNLDSLATVVKHPVVKFILQSNPK